MGYKIFYRVNPQTDERWKSYLCDTFDDLPTSDMTEGEWAIVKGPPRRMFLASSSTTWEEKGVAGSGDMTKAVYDSDLDGVILKAQLDSALANTSGTNTGDQTLIGLGGIAHSLATAINDFLVASGAGVFVKKTLAEVKIILDWAADIATHAGLSTGIHGVGASTVESVSGSQAKVDSHAGSPHPTTDEKAALAGTNGAPSVTNKFVTNSDPRNSDSRTPTAHGLGGSGHSADTLANLQTKVSDATLVALAGQLGGSGPSPDVRGLRETSGPTLLTLGAVADGEYIRRSGASLIGGSPGGGSPPAWKGAIAGAWGDGDPAPVLRHMFAVGVVSPTPTNITTSIARCAFFKLDTALVLNKIRFYGVGATTGIYRVAIYPAVNGASKLVGVNDFNTAAATWGAAGSALNVTLAANTLYLIAVAVNATGTTAGILALSPTVAATTGQITLPTNFPGNLDFDMAIPKIVPYGLCQFAVTTGALPATLPTMVNMAAWTGGMPAFFLDNNNV